MLSDKNAAIQKIARSAPVFKINVTQMKRFKTAKNA
jgi:hypothetical protein